MLQRVCWFLLQTRNVLVGLGVRTETDKERLRCLRPIFLIHIFDGGFLYFLCEKKGDSVFHISVCRMSYPHWFALSFGCVIHFLFPEKMSKICPSFVFSLFYKKTEILTILVLKRIVSLFILSYTDSMKVMFILVIASLFFFSPVTIVWAQSGQTGVAIPITIGGDTPQEGDIVCTGKTGYVICGENYSSAMFGVMTKAPAAAFEAVPQPDQYLQPA